MKKRVISLIIAAMMAAMLLIVPAALAEDNSVMNSAGRLQDLLLLPGRRQRLGADRLRL